MSVATRIAMLAFCMTFLVGCSGSILSSPDSVVFDGLDPTVASEVLENPSARIKIERAPEEIQPGLARGEWIPAQPGDVSGPTIKGVVLGNG